MDNRRDAFCTEPSNNTKVLPTTPILGFVSVTLPFNNQLPITKIQPAFCGQLLIAKIQPAFCGKLPINSLWPPFRIVGSCQEGSPAIGS